jgi:hypothetical protein
MIEGRAYLYNFDFFRFRGHAEETIRPVNTFHCQGVYWKAKFAGTIRLYVNGKQIFSGVMDCGADAHCFLTTFTINIGDEVCILVTDTEPRWFRWFRPNTAHVTLEGLEAEA